VEEAYQEHVQESGDERSIARLETQPTYEGATKGISMTNVTAEH
jgi:hypothetical protein